MKKKFKRKFGEEDLQMFLESNGIEDDSVKEYLNDILFGVSNNQERINELISKNLKENWTIDRVSKINVSILKIAIYEMLYKDIPFRIEINEAVELAKKYSDEQGSSFVNGILGSIVKEENLSEE